LLLRDTILLLALGPLVYYLLTLWAASAYFRGNQKPVHLSRAFAPPVSILKPVRGLDREAYENFASFCLQHYPVYEILFCVNNAADPVVPVIEDLIRDFPERSIRLLVGVPHIGASGKVNKLCRLVREASYDILVISDSDVRVNSNYLQDVVAPLENPKVGAVTVLFRSIGAGSIGGTLDAVGSAVEFAASALLAEKLEGIHFALGATMATTRQRLAEIGGFEALADRYVDDYEFGKRIANKGYQIHLSSSPVNLVYPRQSLLEFLRHELRWSIGLRNVRPLGHAAMGFTLGWLWTILAVIAAPSAFIALLYVLAYLALRSAVYLTIGVWGLEDQVVRRAWWLVPLRDAAAFAVWIASFFSNRISWRGLQFRVKDGGLVPLGDALQFSSASRASSSGFRGRPGGGQHLEKAQETVDEAAISNAIGSQFPNS
jgi:ceramide glucosyltransferase